MDLHKMTGWAVSGLETDPAGSLVDPRVNARSPLLTGTARLVDFVATLSGFDAAMHTDPALAPDEPCRAVVHDGVNGVPGALVVRPVWLPSWHRVGDYLDRAGELGGPDQASARLEYLPSAMWPYAGEFMDADTGAALTDGVQAWTHVVRSVGDPSSPVHDLDDLERDELARATTGFASFAEARRRVAPAVPSVVQALVRWGGLFTDPDMVHQMRPALYTWWS